MTESEREMVRPLMEKAKVEERFTSLQPTYEDSVAPEEVDGWDEEHHDAG